MCQIRPDILSSLIKVSSPGMKVISVIFLSVHQHPFSILDLTVDSFPIELWESGAIYFHNHDKDGHQICKLYI